MHEYTRYHSNISARSLRYTWSTRPHMNTPAHTHTLILLPHPHLHCVQLWERPEHPASTHLPYFFSFLSFILLNSFLSHSQNNNSFSPPPSSLSLPPPATEKTATPTTSFLALRSTSPCGSSTLQDHRTVHRWALITVLFLFWVLIFCTSLPAHTHSHTTT